MWFGIALVLWIVSDVLLLLGLYQELRMRRARRSAAAVVPISRKMECRDSDRPVA